MKYIIFVVSIFSLVACSDTQSNKKLDASKTKTDSVSSNDTIYFNNDNNWQEGFGLTHDPDKDSIWGKPVKYYIDNPHCSPTAIDFYFGQFRPTDNRTTEALLSLASTKDNNLRPFYRWCLNKTILVQDGALAEYTGEPARQYAEAFPAEFFEYMDSDSSNEKYKDWVNAISYSGFYDIDDAKKAKDIRSRMTKTMNLNCKNCSLKLRERINKFAEDCFQ